MNHGREETRSVILISVQGNTSATFRSAELWRLDTDRVFAYSGIVLVHGESHPHHFCHRLVLFLNKLAPQEGG